MKETLSIIVCRKDGSETELSFCFEDDCVSVICDGKELFGADWSANFKKLFERALKIW